MGAWLGSMVDIGGFSANGGAAVTQGYARGETGARLAVQIAREFEGRT
jgi:hypothetical protein